MPDYRVKPVDDMEAIYWGSFKRARAELGLSAFGAQVMDLPPNSQAYPEHDHGHDGQEELYVALRGSGEIELDGERHPIDPDTMVGVQASVKRKVYPGPDGIRLLLIGGVPGKPYEISDLTVLGNPDPVAGQDPPF
ncbi:MAG: cupin protein [Solirubrobacterales bacterium]|nr:cupin protein [Solirubrobacterales bacterium]